MATIIQVRRDTAAAWLLADPKLAEGEMGFETDTYQFKFGDGIKVWSALPYYYKVLDIIQITRDTYTNFYAANLVYDNGQMLYETDTDKFKIADGVKTWRLLPYAFEQPNIQIYRGTAELDFGATPTDEATVVVTGLATMTATANIHVFIVGDDTTSNNTAVDHDGFTYMAILHAGARVAGVGFTITGRIWNGFVTGKFKVHYHYTI